jgi:hypothetical protein
LFLDNLQTTSFNSGLSAFDDPQKEFDLFYEIALGLLNKFYPEKTVTMTSNDPEYLTPAIKASLRRKNKLMRAGRVEEAGALAKRIGADIIKKNSVRLRQIDGRVNSKEMWEKVQQLSNRCRREVVSADVTATALNTHYAGISVDNSYSVPPRKSSAPISAGDENQFTEEQVFHLLDHLHSTATGLDNLPAWFLRLGAPVFAKPIARLFNQSICSSFVPIQWKRAYIRPVAKVQDPVVPADFRPISITAVLSRLLEKLVVRSYIYPALLMPPPALSFSDQYAFRPTGSTTAAIISFLHTITNLLTTNPYVVVYGLDFSKAFDTVRHATLLEKIAMLELPDCVYNWLVDFFEHRSHCTIYNGEISELLEILASIVQGSVIGPASYVVNAGDMKTKHPENVLVKFADDTYLIVPASMVETREEELANISDWAVENNLKLNNSKTVEIVFRKPRNRGSIILPSVIPGITRADKIKMLGVTISWNFSVQHHIDEVTTSCARSLFALRTLRAHGMKSTDLHTVFQSAIISRLTYAAPAWWGFANAADRNRLENFLKKGAHAGFCSPGTRTFVQLCEDADDTLFEQIIMHPAHVLHSFLQIKTSVDHDYNLRQRKHKFALPDNSNSLLDCNFMNRVLFKNINKIIG